MGSRDISSILTTDCLDSQNITKIFQAYEKCIIEDVEFSGIEDRAGREENDNYNSTMHQAKVKYKVGGEIKEHHLIIKVPPKGFLGKASKLSKPFSRETLWYSTFVDELKKIDPEIENLSPTCFLCSTNYDLTDQSCCEARFPWICWCPCQSDVKAIIMLENLTTRTSPQVLIRKGQVPSLPHVKMAIESLAKFHGSWWLYRHKISVGEINDPPFSLKEMDTRIRLNLPLVFFSSVAKASMKLIERLLTKHGDTRTAAWVREYRKEKILDRVKFLFLGIPADPSKITTIVHGDFWTNNMMFSHNEEGEPTGMTIIDYQMLTKAHPVCDIAYFLYIATNREFREKHLEAVLEAYFTQFEKYLKKTEVDFSYQNFREEYESHKDYGLIFASGTMPNVLNPVEIELSGMFAIREYNRQREGFLLEEKPDEHPIYKEIRTRLMDMAKEMVPESYHK